MRIFLLIVLCSVLCAVGLWGQDAVENDPLNAVVKVECVSSSPNFIIPWQNQVHNSGVGSGVVISGKRILTNAHNVADATLINIRKQNDDTLHTAKIIAVDHESDLALLTVDDNAFWADITPFGLGPTPPPQTQVLAVGFPIGGDGISMTQGIISRIEVHRYVHSSKWLLAAQIDAAINPGNSGGPIFYEGKVVGIAFQGSRAGEALGYMIPYEIIKHFLNDWEDGKIDGFGVLGFKYATLDNPDTRRYLKMKPDQTGVLISSLFKQVPDGTVQKNDVLLAIDGKTVANNGNIRMPNGEPRNFTVQVMEKQLGETVNLTLLRDGQIVSVALPVQKFGEMVNERLYDKLPDYYVIGGLVFTTLSYSYLDSWNAGEAPTALVAKVYKEKESPDQDVVVLSLIMADEVNMGYQNIDCVELTHVNGQKVKNLKDLIATIEQSNDEFITFTVGEDFPIILDLKKLKAATPRILERYRVPADRSANLK